MALSADQLAHFAATVDPRLNGAAGAIEAALRTAEPRERYGNDLAGSEQARALRAWRDRHPRTERPAGYTSALTSTPVGSIAPGPFSAADVEFLRRLPTDPAALDDEQVAALVELEFQATERGDRRLIAAIMAPVRELDERRAAQYITDAARKFPEPPRADELHGVLADAIRREEPALTADEAATRARIRLDEAHEELIRVHHARLAPDQMIARPQRGPSAPMMVAQREREQWSATTASRVIEGLQRVPV